MSGRLGNLRSFHVSVEWVRRLLLELHPEQTPKERRRAAHTLRRRRASRGELVQIDGSPHFWFPGDAERRTLIAFIDDATSELLSAYFSPTEDTEAYVNALEYKLVHNGIPMAIYSDRHSVFTSNVDEARRKSKPQPTQFQKICDHLGIELILAHSPEAKGRVERLFQTLQKRWPKEFRILGIHNLAEANERMPELIEAYNREFAITPADSKDSHIRLNEVFISHTPNPVQDGQFPLKMSATNGLTIPKYISFVLQVATRFRSSQALSLNFEQLSSDCKLLGRLCAGLFVRMRIAE